MNELTRPIILAIETATRAGSVSLARGTDVLASRTGDAVSSHSTDLIENIDAVLRDANAKLAAVDLFAAAAGPGSFTGLRIGLATIKSLAVALQRKCAGISTLAAVAYQAGPSERTVALLPAGRGELFAQMFAVHRDSVEPLDEATHVAPEAMLKKYGDYRPLWWAGEGAHAQIEFLRAEAKSQNLQLIIQASDSTNGVAADWIVAPARGNVADAIARLALQQWRAGALTAPENLRADYVRASDAQIKTKS